jgi:hypothetical protein
MIYRNDLSPDEAEFLELVDQLSPNEQAELATHLREIAEQGDDHE